jgi:hypothetical protein
VKKLLTIAALTATTLTAQAEVRINGFANLIISVPLFPSPLVLNASLSYP